MFQAGQRQRVLLFNEKIYLDERRDLLFIQFEKDLPEELFGATP